MKRTTNAKGFALALSLIVLSLPIVASADPIIAEYEIGYYAVPGYSASWQHESTGCPGPAANGRGTLYMCGGDMTRLAGSIEGMLHAGELTNITGVLTNFNSGATVATIIDGILRPFVSGGNNSFFRFADGDTAFFEVFSMGSGLPNYFDGEQFILWGQNTAAYRCRPGDSSCGERFGLDLYGSRVTVPEPGTLALFGIGLIGLGMTRRRRTA